MGKRRRHETFTYQAVTTVQPTIPVQPTTFSPPIAMQQSVWDSIVNGNFVDAKIFAFSRRSHEPGQVNTPKPLFVNTHVLATACSYFRSSPPFLFFRGLSLTVPAVFDFPDGIVTSLNAGLPPGMEPVFDVAERDPDSDYDDPIEINPAKIQPPVNATASKSAERTVKAYIVKYTAYRTFVGSL